MTYKNNPQLRSYLSNGFPELASQDSFEVPDGAYDLHYRGTEGRPASERADAAVFRYLTFGKIPAKKAVSAVLCNAKDYDDRLLLAEMASIRKLIRFGVIAGIIGLLLIFGAVAAHAQNVNPASVVTTCGTPVATIPGTSQRAFLTINANGELCISGTITAMVEGSDGAILDGASAAIKATVKDYTNSNPLTVVTVDTNGDYVAGAGGVQYTEGDTDASITGTALLFEGAANTLIAAPGTAAAGLLVNVSNASLTVTDGSGALNTIVDSGTLTAVTTITNAVTVTDGSGALNVIVDSGSITVTDGSGALNVIVDSGTVTTVSTVTSLSQFAGAAINLQGGTIGTGTLRVTIATDDPVNDALVKLDAAIVVEDAPETAGANLVGIGAVRRDAAATSATTAGDNATFNTDANGLLWTRSQDPCSALAKSYFPFDITTGTTTEVTPSLGGASNYWYVCAINIVTTAANNVNLVDDNTDGCGSVTASLISSGLAAGDGWGFGANGGLTIGNGNGAVLKSVTTNSVLCLVTSASSELHGTIVAVAAP